MRTDPKPCFHETVIKDTGGAGNTEKRARQKHSPAFIEILPNIVLQPVRVGQLLYEMLDRVLPEAEEIWPRHGVAMLAVAHVVCGTNDDRPCASRGTRNNWLVGHVRSDDLELGSVATIKDRAVVDHIRVRVARGVVAPAKGTQSVEGEETGKA